MNAEANTAARTRPRIRPRRTSRRPIDNRPPTVGAAYGTALTADVGDRRFADYLEQVVYTRARRFTYIDLFCGAGGSSIGLAQAGGHLLLAANHSPRAIATHESNFVNAEHLCADLNRYDMRGLPAGAEVLWASVICHEVSPSGGKGGHKRAKARKKQHDGEDGEPVEDETVHERTRATALDVIAAAYIHRFKMVIVENVVEFATEWQLFGWWLAGMLQLGYRVQVVCVSSAHISGPDYAPAPQNRDRMYLVFNRADLPAPDVAPRPTALCTGCGGNVEAVQTWKCAPHDFGYGQILQVGKYPDQYIYTCPTCREHVEPYVLPAAAVINWADLGTPIGQRKTPLVEATMNRIEAGLRRYFWPGPDGTFGDRDVAWLDANGGSWNTAWASVNAPFRTRTTTEWEGLFTLGAGFIDTQRNNGRLRPASEPLATITAGGYHHGVVGVPAAQGLLVPYYRTGVARPASRPFGTLTTKDRHALVRPTSVDINACTYRMIRWYEQAAAQAFPLDYVLTGNGKERTAQVGNAVSANVARWLGTRIDEALNRTVAAA